MSTINPINPQSNIFFQPSDNQREIHVQGFRNGTSIVDLQGEVIYSNVTFPEEILGKPSFGAINFVGHLDGDTFVVDRAIFSGRIERRS